MAILCDPKTWTQAIWETTATPIFTVILIGIVGNWLAGIWNERQGRRQQAQARADELFAIHGAFFANWKKWNLLHSQPAIKGYQEKRQALFEEVCEAEGRMEALMVKLSAERFLDPYQISLLGSFRQGYQSIRGAIKNGSRLDWNASNHPDYIAFKRLSVMVSRIVSIAIGPSDRPMEQTSKDQLTDITSNKWETQWIQTGESRQ